MFVGVSVGVAVIVAVGVGVPVGVPVGVGVTVGVGGMGGVYLLTPPPWVPNQMLHSLSTAMALIGTMEVCVTSQIL